MRKEENCCTKYAGFIVAGTFIAFFATVTVLIMNCNC